MTKGSVQRRVKKSTNNKLQSRKKFKQSSKPKTPLPFVNKLVHQFKSWCGKVLFLTDDQINSVDMFLDYLNHLERYKGINFAIKVIKDVRLSIECYLAGSPKNGKSNLITRLNYVGLPKILFKAIHYIKSDKTNFCEFVLSILTIGRSVKFTKVPDYSSISSPSTQFDSIPIYIYEKFFKDLRFKYKKTYNKNIFEIPTNVSYHFSNKSSPSGIVAIDCFMIELISLPEHILTTLIHLGGDSLREKVLFLKNNYSDITKTMPKYQENIKSIYNSLKIIINDLEYPVDIYNKNDKFFRVIAPYVLGKLVSFSEYEGKTRIIALCNYWYQLALGPIADQYFSILRIIDQDRTYDQGRGLGDLRFSKDITYYSYDIKTFTDRFPKKEISSMVTAQLKSEYSRAVTDILCCQPLWCPDLSKFLVYEVGTPMGLRASWALTTVNHHIVIYYACHQLKISWWKAPYVMLGDDIVIWSEPLALLYKEILKSLGLELSDKKTIIGKNLLSFAKRNFTPRGEISPISFREWVHSISDFESLFELINRLTLKKRIIGRTKEELLAISLSYFGVSEKGDKIQHRLTNNQNKKIRILTDIYSKNNFLENLHSIYVTHCAGSSKNYLPMCIEPLLKKWAYEHLLDIYDKQLREFKGHFTLKELQLDDHDQSKYLLLAFFDQIDSDNYVNSLTSCHPWLSLNESLIERKLVVFRLQIVNSSKSVIEDMLTFFTGLQILDLTSIERQVIKSCESSIERNTLIKFSGKVLRFIKNLFSFIRTNIKELRNSFPLMVQ